MKYILLDANVTAGYYLWRSLSSKIARERITNILDSGRSGESKFFFYLPNFCVAEVFSVFMKYSFGTWNAHVKGKSIDTRVYNSLVRQFQSDIHNGKFIYHYELNRYHVLGINLVAPVDHHFQITQKKKKQKQPRPMSTFDHLILSMGIHLVHVHGRENVLILSADNRLTNVLKKCRDGLPYQTQRKLKLLDAETVTGKKFGPDIFPKGLNLGTTKKSELEEEFGEWPLSVGQMPKPKRPYRCEK